MAESAQTTNLATLNIFDILGMTEVSQEDQEAILADFQDVIWQEIVESDYGDDLGDNELDEVEEILNNESRSIEEKRNDLFAFLTDKIDNLEVVLEEKTNMLKMELLSARIEGMTEFFAEQPEKQGQVAEANQMVESGQYAEAVQRLNQMAAEIPQETTE